MTPVLIPCSRSREWEGGLLISCARATRSLRRPSLDARSGRSSRTPSREEKASKLEGHLYRRTARSTTAVGPTRVPFQERDASELGRIIQKDEGRENRIGTTSISSRLHLAGCGKILWACRNFTGLHVWNTRSTPRRMLKKAVQQGRSSAADPRFTFYVSRFTAHGSEARTPLADFFSILLERMLSDGMRRSRSVRAIGTFLLLCRISPE